MMKSSLLLLACLFPTLAAGSSSTAFNINSVSCDYNTPEISYSTCGLNGKDPCEFGEKVTLSGTYTVSKTISQEVKVCGKVQVFGVKVYDAGCDSVNLCDYIQCDNSGTEDYIDSNGSPYYFSFNDLEIPGSSRWIGSGYGFGFVVSAVGYNGNEVEQCKVVVSTTTISSSAAVVAVASLCAAAALYYRRKRRTATIDLAKEENLVQADHQQGDFVEMARTGVSV